MTRVLVGNLLSSAMVTMTPAADPLFPKEFLFDGPGQLGAAFGALDANPEVVIDLSEGGIPNGDGAVVGASPGDILASSNPSVLIVDTPTDWTVELIGGSPTSPAFVQMYQDADLGFFANDHGGNDRTLAVGANSGSAIARAVLTRRAGTSHFVNGWVTNGGSATVGGAVRLYNRTTGRWLGVDGEWHATAQDLVTDATTDHVWLGVNAGAGVSFDIPSAVEMGGSEEAVLEYQLVVRDASGLAFFDDLVLDSAQPVDFMGVFNGHNVSPGLAPVWESSDDGVSWTNRATFTVAAHQFFARLDTPVVARFHRLAMTGAPVTPVFMSDLVLGLTQALEREPQDPIDKEYSEPGQQRLESPAGARRISNRGPYAPRRYTLRFRFATAAEEASVMALLVGQVRGGEQSILVLPAADLGPAGAVYGDLQAGAAVTHNMLSAFQPDNESREYYSDATFTVDEGVGFTMGG